MKVSRLFMTACFAALILLAGCKTKVDPGTGNGGNLPTENNPQPCSSRAANLDYIFSTESLGTVTITMNRSEWNQMLKNYDYFYKNENCVKFICFEYEKNGTKWNLTKGGGIRLRGNTSRFRPQGKDYPVDQSGRKEWNGITAVKPNADWSKEYYDYAANCSDDDYRQSHFKIDFEEFLTGEDEQKMAGCMKGIALKRMDGSCTKEIFCYDLFHRLGIWTAPRASHTRVLFNFIEDNGKTTKVDFGVYEMFEEVNKQSLKARDKDENKAGNAWKNSKGNLWKCATGDLTSPDVKFGCENIEITSFDAKGNPTGYIWDAPTYDLKTNKDNVESASLEFKQFITELNAASDEASIKAFYEKWMDVDFFLKSYAINVMVGMDDDYWANANNYYLYFADTSKGRKVYFIPFDYDNTLGSSIGSENGIYGIQQSPLEWGRGKNRPLLDKILKVPEFKQKYIDYIKEVSDAEGEWNFEKGKSRFKAWQDMCSPYLNSPDLEGHIATKGVWEGCWNPGDVSLSSKNNNLYDYTRSYLLYNVLESYPAKVTFDLNGGNIDGNTASVQKSFPSGPTKPSAVMTDVPVKDGFLFECWTATKDGSDMAYLVYSDVLYAKWKDIRNVKDLNIADANDSGYTGIKIKINNVPPYFTETGDGARCRQIYVNGVKVSDESGEDLVKAEEWAFPYTVKGETYNIYVRYLKSDWYTELARSNVISIKAKSGEGKFTLESDALDVEIKNNVFHLKQQPVIYVGGVKMTEGNSNRKFYVNIHDVSWSYVNNEKKFEKVYQIPDFNIKDFLTEQNKLSAAEGKEMEATLRFKVYGTNWGEYKLDIPLKNNKFTIQ